MMEPNFRRKGVCPKLASSTRKRLILNGLYRAHYLPPTDREGRAGHTRGLHLRCSPLVEFGRLKVSADSIRGSSYSFSPSWRGIARLDSTFESGLGRAATSLPTLVYIDHLEAFRRPTRDDSSDDLSRAVPNGVSGLATESDRTVPSVER